MTLSQPATWNHVSAQLPHFTGPYIIATTRGDVMSATYEGNGEFIGNGSDRLFRL